MALVQVNFISRSLLRTVTINAIIPVDKIGVEKTSDKPFKTLYLLHGIFGNYTDWVTGTRIQRWAEKHNLAVIMPSGENKFYVDHPDSMDNFSTFIGEELVEVTRRLFPLSDKREDTYIAGLSMGGYGALTNGLKYYQTFGYIAGLSSALVLDDAIHSVNDPKLPPISQRSYYVSQFGDLDQLKGSEMDYEALARRLASHPQDFPKIFMACGTEDFLYQVNVAYRDFLKQQGAEVTFMEGPGGHDWDFWDTYILKVLEWLPLDDESEGMNSGHVSV